MSRRNCSLSGLAGIAIALVTGMYAPRYANVDEPSCAADILPWLDPCEEVAVNAVVKSHQEAFIEVQIRAVMTSPVPNRPKSRGVVRDCYRLLEAVSGDHQAHVMQAPIVTVFNGQSFVIPAAAVRSGVAEDGVTPILIELGLKSIGTVNLCEDGRIRLSFENWLTSTSFKSYAKGSFVLRDGQTCFIGGLAGKVERRTEFGVPMLSKLPGVGEHFPHVRWEPIDAELMFLVTPKLVGGP